MMVPLMPDPNRSGKWDERHPIRLISKPNGGQSSARNLGVEYADGDLIAFLDQDDVWYPNHLVGTRKAVP